MTTAEISDLFLSNVLVFSSNRIKMSCHKFLLLALYKDILLNYYLLFMLLKHAWTWKFLEAKLYFCIKTQNHPLIYKSKYSKRLFWTSFLDIVQICFSVIALTFHSKLVNCHLYNSREAKKWNTLKENKISMETCGRDIFSSYYVPAKVISKRLTWFLRNYREIRLFTW